MSADRSRVRARQPGRNWASVKAAPRTTGDHQSVKATPRTGDHLTVKADPPAGDWSTVKANPQRGADHMRVTAAPTSDVPREPEPETFEQRSYSK